MGEGRVVVPPPAPQEETRQQYGTPDPLHLELANRFAGGFFTLDVAASDMFHVCENYFTFEQNGLALPWGELSKPERVWCNPPWNNIKPWIVKGHEEVERGRAWVAVYLLPARMGSDWYAYAMSHGFYAEPIRGRVAFKPPPGVKTSSGFEDCCVLVKRKQIVAREFVQVRTWERGWCQWIDTM